MLVERENEGNLLAAFLGLQAFTAHCRSTSRKSTKTSPLTASNQFETNAPPFLFIQGPPQSGKWSLVKDVVERWRHPNSTYNPRTVLTSAQQGAVSHRLLLEDILTQLFPDHRQTVDVDSNATRSEILAALIDQASESDVLRQHSDNLSDFILYVKRFTAELVCQPVFIVVRDAEMLRQLSAIADSTAHLLHGLLRLRELTSIPTITVVLISRLPWHTFQTATCLPTPLILILQPYTRAQLINVVKCVLHAENSALCDGDSESSRGELNGDFFSNYANIIVGTFFSSTRHVSDILTMARQHLDRYAEPVLSGRSNASNVRALYRNIDPDLRQSLANFDQLNEEIGKLRTSHVDGATDMQPLISEQADVDAVGLPSRLGSRMTTPVRGSAASCATTPVKQGQGGDGSASVVAAARSLNQQINALSTPVRTVLGIVDNNRAYEDASAVSPLARHHSSTGSVSRGVRTPMSIPRDRLNIAKRRSLFGSPTKQQKTGGASEEPLLRRSLMQQHASATIESLVQRSPLKESLPPSSPSTTVTVKRQSRKAVFNRLHVELPYHSKLLLIAAYIASHNPARTDRRFFTIGGAQKCRKSKASMRAKERAAVKQRLAGPAAFPVDRMMAIHRAIVRLECLDDDDVDARAYSSRHSSSSDDAISTQIASLITLNLLHCASATPDINWSQFESTKLRCSLHFSIVNHLAKQVGVQIEKFLYV